MVNINFHSGNYRLSPDFRAEFDVPPSINLKYECVDGRRVKTQLYKNWIEANCKKMLHQFNNYKIPPDVPAFLKIRANVARIRDLDNLIKPISDCLQKAGFIPNDCYFDELDVKRSSEIPLRRFRVEFGEITPGLTPNPASDEFEYRKITKSGRYQAMITDSMTMPYADQTDRYIAFTFEVSKAYTNGVSKRNEFIGYRFADLFCINDRNENKKFEDSLRLSQLIESVYKEPESIDNTEELKGLETMVELEVSNNNCKVIKYSKH